MTTIFYRIMEYITDRLIPLASIALIILILYTVFGTSGRVEAIKKKAPQEIAERHWKILRYEGFQYGSWQNHGGKVWYHVANTDNPSIQYRVCITMWNGELQYHYGNPETLNRVEVEYK